MTGSVYDDVDPTGLSVSFGDLLAGYGCTVLEDDTFIFVIQLDPSTHGTITAQVTDAGGLTSQLVMTYV